LGAIFFRKGSPGPGILIKTGKKKSSDYCYSLSTRLDIGEPKMSARCIVHTALMRSWLSLLFIQGWILSSQSEADSGKFRV